MFYPSICSTFRVCNPGVIAVVGVIVGTLSVAGCEYQSGHMFDTPLPASFNSNGERIYFTGRSERNSEISFAGGGMHMQMMGGACATCHGADRRGGARMMPYFWKTAPPLTAEALFDSHETNSGGHGDHDSYDEATLRRAINTGLDPAGKMLDELMPRWRMNDEDMGDLIAFLKS